MRVWCVVGVGVLYDVCGLFYYVVCGVHLYTSEGAIDAVAVALSVVWMSSARLLLMGVVVRDLVRKVGVCSMGPTNAHDIYQGMMCIYLYTWVYANVF